jgi:hypothetical protein
MISTLKTRLGECCGSIQLDYWSAPNASESYGAIYFSFIWHDAVTGKRSLEQFLLEFMTFPRKRHTHINLANWILSVLKLYDLDRNQIELFVPDGAANGLKALNKIGARWRVCDAHQLQRCIQYGTGEAGGNNCMNPEFRQLLKRNETMVTKLHTSIHLNKDLKESQIAEGITGAYLSSTNSRSATRWSGGKHICSNNIKLEQHIIAAFNGTMQDEYDAEHADQVADTQMILEDNFSGAEEEVNEEEESPSAVLLTPQEWRDTKLADVVMTAPEEVQRTLEGEKYTTADLRCVADTLPLWFSHMGVGGGGGGEGQFSI